MAGAGEAHREEKQTGTEVRPEKAAASGMTAGELTALRGQKARTALIARRRALPLTAQWAILVGALAVLDAVTVYASLTLAYTVRFSSGILAYSSTYDPGAYQRFTLASLPIWTLLFLVFGLYRRDVLWEGVVEYRNAIGACIIGVLAVITLSFFWRGTLPLSRGWLLLSLGFSILLLVSERFLVRRLGYLVRRRGWLTAKVLIVGANDQGSAIAEQWHANSSSGMCVVGFVDDFKPMGSPVQGERI